MTNQNALPVANTISQQIGGYTMKLYALLSRQGTACVETVLTETEYADLTMRSSAEHSARMDKGPDAPMPGTWIDVSENEACWFWDV